MIDEDEEYCPKCDSELIILNGEYGSFVDFLTILSVNMASHKNKQQIEIAQ